MAAWLFIPKCGRATVGEEPPGSSCGDVENHVWHPVRSCLRTESARRGARKIARRVSGTV